MQPTPTSMPPPPGTSGGGFSRFLKTRWGFLVIGFLIGGAVGVGAGTSNRPRNEAASSHAPPAVTSPSATVSQPSSPLPSPSPPAPQPDSKATYTHSCSYVLGDFTEHTATGYRFIGSTKIHNTGNVGIKVRVTMKWDQVGTNPITRVSTVKVPYQGFKPVNVTVDVGINEIDLIQ